MVKDFDDMILRVARQHGIIPHAVYTIPNMTTMMIRIADDLFFELAEASRDQHTYDPELVRRCCQYLFKKAAEAVIRWGEAEDGRVDLKSGIAEAVSDGYTYQRFPKRAHLVIEKCDEFGDAVFQAHLDHIESQHSYTGEMLRAEIFLIFRWCVTFGISWAIESKCYSSPPAVQQIETISPTAETFAWIRAFVV
jgi:hypothetical protein